MSGRAYGADGERMAADFLAGKGLEILARNVRGAFGEVDLVARDGDTIAFVEVKRRASRFGRPGEAVNREKCRRIALTAREYLQARGLEDARARFDVVEISADRILHLPGAFDATGLFD